MKKKSLSNKEKKEDLRAQISKLELQKSEINLEISKRYKEIQTMDVSDTKRREFETWAADKRTETGTIKGQITRLVNMIKEISGDE